jgi:hypothetical protein
MDTPKLRIPQWQEALERVSPHLNRFQNDLNAISDDIRSLEKYLTESGFRIRVRVTAGFDEGLSWSDVGKNSWRICYCEPVGENFSERPLIEMPASIRWQLADLMPRLLNEIAEVASRIPESVSIPSDDDIPF